MEERDRTPVLETLQELEGWAAYIVEALHLNQGSEPVKTEMMERTLGEQSLRQIRELSWSLRDKLHLVRTQLELSRPAEPPGHPVTASSGQRSTSNQSSM